MYDVINVYLPFTPFDASPPLGPAILQAHLEDAGYAAINIDLNIHYLNLFRQEAHTQEGTIIIGDHAENTLLAKLAEEHYTSSLKLPDVSVERIPCCCQPIWSLPYSFDEIEEIVFSLVNDSFWEDYFKQYLFLKYEEPLCLGLSIMGPSQVLLALVCAYLCKRYWPKATIVAGGSHITLLADKIAASKTYGQYIDYFLPQHSEHTYVKFVSSLKVKTQPDFPGILQAGKQYISTPELPLSDRLPPVFNQEEMSLYDEAGLSYPLQLRRGCGYGRCTYCTYPAIEEFEKISIRQAVMQFMPELLKWNPQRISLKDSLLDLNAMTAFGEELQKLDSQVTWSATTKLVPGMNMKSMQYLYDLGCRTVEFGIETIHPNTQQVLDKYQPIDKVDAVLEATLDAGIIVIANLIFGVPTETQAQAEEQLNWYLAWKAKYPDRLFGSFNMLEINHGSPLALQAKKLNLELKPIGPWAFSYQWNAPTWRQEFADKLRVPDNLQYLTSPVHDVAA